jgi:hypothetical protein
MAWDIAIRGRWRAKYIYFKNNYRVGKSVKTKWIYLGPSDVAIKILGDLQTKPLIDERLMTYSGEIILSRITDSISLTQVLANYTKSEKEASILKNIIVLRALFNESKKGLIERILPNSILKDDIDIAYVEKVYRCMDSIYDHLDDLIYELAKNAVKKYKLDLTYLAIDCTGIKIYKDEETGLVKFGYPHGGLPQVKLVLGVNRQHIPILGKCYPGSTSDVKVFDDIIGGLDFKYEDLCKRAKKKYVIFDQGNLSKKTVDHIRKYGDKGIFFVSLVRPGTRKRFIGRVNKSEMKLVYEREISKNKHTKIYGKPMKGKVYEKECSVLVCYDPDIEVQKNKSLDRKVEDVKNKLIDVNKSKKPDSTEVEALISKHKLKRALNVKGKKKLELVVNDIELKERRKYFGFFVLFSNDLGLGCDMIIIYKIKDVIEEGFRALKSDMEITPEYHSRDDRIETHNVLVVCGYLLLSILRAVLAASEEKYSFGALKRLLVSGYLGEGYYEHEQFKDKRLWLRQPKGFVEELKTLFSSVRVKVPKFDVDLVPTNFRKN